MSLNFGLFLNQNKNLEVFTLGALSLFLTFYKDKINGKLMDSETYFKIFRNALWPHLYLKNICKQEYLMKLLYCIFKS